jgi:hypothetical protein
MIDPSGKMGALGVGISIGIGIGAITGGIVGYNMYGLERSYSRCISKSIYTFFGLALFFWHC